MQMTEIEYRQLKAQIDADAKAEVDRVEHERVQNHQALDRVWAMMRRKVSSASVQPPNLFNGPTSMSTSGTNGHIGGKREDRMPFPMKATIREFIANVKPPKVSQPVVYEFLCTQHPKGIAGRNQDQVKGQITNVLSKLAEGEDAILDVVSEAIGGNPKIFRPKRHIDERD